MKGSSLVVQCLRLGALGLGFNPGQGTKILQASWPCVYSVTQSCATLCDPMDCSHKAPLSMGFSGKKTGVGSYFLLQEIFLTEGSKPRTHISCLAGSFFTTKPPGKPQGFMVHMLKALLMGYANALG